MASHALESGRGERVGSPPSSLDGVVCVGCRLAGQSDWWQWLAPDAALNLCASGRVKALMSGPLPIFEFRMNIQNRFELPKPKIENGTFPMSNNYEKFKSHRKDEKEPRSILVKLPIQNKIQNINSTSF
jgi:hypothetical protein